MHNSLDSLLWKYTEGGEIMHVASTSLRKQRERTAPRLWHQLRYSHLNREAPSSECAALRSSSRRSFSCAVTGRAQARHSPSASFWCCSED